MPIIGDHPFLSRCVVSFRFKVCSGHHVSLRLLSLLRIMNISPSQKKTVGSCLNIPVRLSAERKLTIMLSAGCLPCVVQRSATSERCCCSRCLMTSVLVQVMEIIGGLDPILIQQDPSPQASVAACCWRCCRRAAAVSRNSSRG